MRAFVYLGITVLLILAIQAGRCDGGVLFDVLNKGVYPLTVQLRELEGWKCFTLAEQTAQAEAGHPAEAIAFPSKLFFTRGEMLPLGNELLLVAYRLPAQAIDLTAAQAIRAMLPVDLMNPETELVISLLNLHTISMLDIRPAEAGLLQLLGDEEKLERLRAEARRVTSMNNLRQLIVSLQIWINKNNDTFPPTGSIDDVKKALLRNTPELTKMIWVDPVTRQPYQYNPSMAGKTLNDFRGKEHSIVVFYSNEYPDGTRTVVFFDGHAENVPPERWEELKELSGIPRQ
jgi:prepilin-type processing-associated H-X9-DG protein